MMHGYKSFKITEYIRDGINSFNDNRENIRLVVNFRRLTAPVRGMRHTLQDDPVCSL